MTVSVNWNGTSYTIPESGETNWSNLTDFLVALGSYAQTTTKQVSGVRTATSSPVTLTTADYTVVTNLSVAGAVAVTLPTGVLGQVFVITDGRGDAGTNAVTISGGGAQTINGSTHVIDENYGGAIFQFNGTTWNVLAGFVGNSPKFTSLTITGNATVGGTLAVTGASTFASTVNVTGALTKGTIEVPTISSASVLTNKDIDGGTASNTNRITLPKDTLTNLNALTRKAGTVVYDTTNSLVKFDNGTSLIAMSGDMVGPVSATANAITRFDSTTGKLVKNSAVTIDDTGDLSGTAASFSSTLAVTGATTFSSTLAAGSTTIGTGGAGVALAAISGNTTLGIKGQSNVVTTAATIQFGDGDTAGSRQFAIINGHNGTTATPGTLFIMGSTAGNTSAALGTSIQLASVTATGAWTLGPASAIGTSTYAGNNIVGRTNGTVVAVGYVGQVMQSVVTTAQLTVAFANVTSLTLTPGRWLVSGMVSMKSSPTTRSLVGGCITLTSGGSGTNGTSTVYSPCMSDSVSVSYGQARPQSQVIDVSVNTIIYLTGNANIASSAANDCGELTAVRIA